MAKTREEKEGFLDFHEAEGLEDREPAVVVYKKKKSLPPKPENDNPFLYRAEISCCTQCLLCCMPLICCFEPFAVVALMTERSKQYQVSEYRFRFDGTAGEYCCDVCMFNKFIGCITCGIWSFCGCAQTRKNKWIDNHLHFFSSQKDTARGQRAGVSPSTP